MDLNEIDLVTERLGIFGLQIEEKPIKTQPKYHSKIPKLDLKKLMKMKEEENDEDYEEEEEEAEEDIKSSQKKFFQDGSALVSDDSFERREELKHRKEQVIALLNKTYGDEESIAPISSFEKSK